MSIKGNNSSAIILAVSGDFTILQNTTTTRWAVEQIHLTEIGSTGDTVAFFRSPDATSASGDQVDSVVVASDSSDIALAPTVVLEAGEFLVGSATTGSLVNVWAIYTTYTGSS